MSNWSENNNELTKTFESNTFMEAMNWMVKASVEIEKLNHHPTWTNEYNKVHVCSTTHDEGNTVTNKDRILVKALNIIEQSQRLGLLFIRTKQA